MIRASIPVLLGFAAATLACYHVAQLAALARPRAHALSPEVYAERCSRCHGEAGRGDGPAGRSLDPPSRDFTDGAWQAATSDERIRGVIRSGGREAGLSPQMPSHADLSEREIDELVAYIRLVGREPSARR